MNSAVNNGPAQRAPSYYTATLNDPTQYPTLTGTEQVDVAIIGGGFTGVATAVELAERGLKVAIVETNRIGWGASGRNGGQVTGSLSGDEAMRTQMRKRLGEDVDDFIWHLRWRGHEIIERRVERYGIDCDLKRGHLHAAMKPSHMDELQASYDEAQRRGMGDLVHLLDRNAVSEHLQSPLYRRPQEPSQPAPAPAQPMLGRSARSPWPGRTGFRELRGAGDRPWATPGGGHRPRPDRGAPGAAGRRCLSQAGKAPAQGQDLPGHGRHRHHCAAR